MAADLESLLGDLVFYDPYVRASAATALGTLGDPRAIQPLVGNLTDPHRDSDPFVSEAIVEALARFGEQAREPLVRALLAGRDQGAWAARALARIPGCDPEVRLVAALRSPELRRQAADVLRAWRNPAATPLLAATLHDPDAIAAGWAALVLAQAVPGYEGLLPYLGAALASPDQRLRWEVALALQRMGDPKARELVAGAATDPRHAGRAEAAVALGDTGDARAVPALVAALADLESAPNRTWLNNAFQRIGAPAVEPLSAATRDERSVVRVGAANALGLIRDTRALPALVALLADPVPEVRASAAKALARLHDPRAVEGLLALSTDVSPVVRREAAIALGELRAGCAVEPLLPLLRDPDAAVRRWTAFALGLLRDPRATKELVATLADVDLEVACGAADALGEIGAQDALPALLRLAELYEAGASERRPLYLQASRAIAKMQRGKA